MTVGELAASIRGLPGITSVTRWQAGRQDHLYIVLSTSEPGDKTFVDLRCGVLFGAMGWQNDLHGIGERAVTEIRKVCEVYRRERIAELKRSVKV